MVDVTLTLSKFIMLKPIKAKIKVPIPLAETRMMETEDRLLGKNW
jgi:hypothetical protein